MSPSPADSPDRRAVWGSDADLEADAAAMRPAAAALGAADRARALKLVDGSLARVADDVARVDFEYAARRLALFGKKRTADRELERYASHFGPERQEELRERADSFRARANDEDKGWLKRERDEHREPLPSPEYLRRHLDLGPRVTDHEPLAALSRALRTVERAEAVEPPRRPDLEGREAPLEGQIRHLLGPRYAEVDRIASLLDGAAERRSDAWLEARRGGFRETLELELLSSTHRLSELESFLGPEIAGGGVDALRSDWINHHGPLAGVYLHTERQQLARQIDRETAASTEVESAAAIEPPPPTPDTGLDFF